MKVSVALAVYNGEKYINEQLDSLHSQRLQPDEVVICDDASTDSSAKIIEEYITGNNLAGWQLVRNEQNLGYIMNFRKAISLCSGDCILLCDQDDVWHSDKIEKLVSAMESESQILSLASSCSFIDEEGNVPSYGIKPFYKYAGRWKEGSLHAVGGKLLYGNVAQGCACIYRRELTDEYLRCPQQGGLPHDWALNLLAYEKGGLYYLNEKLFDYRLHSGNTTGAVTREASVKDRADILKNYSDNLMELINIVSDPERIKAYEKLEKLSRLREKMVRESRPLLVFRALCKYPGLAFGQIFPNLLKDAYAACISKHSRG